MFYVVSQIMLRCCYAPRRGWRGWHLFNEEFMHPAEVAYPMEYRLTLAAADRNALAIQAALPSPDALNERIRQIIRSTDGPTRNLLALREIADQMAAVVGPRSACRSGCAHCCHIAVLMSSTEARLIGREIGLDPASAKPLRLDRKRHARVVEKHFGQACSFLDNGLCGIYPYRPLACRLHFNIGHGPFFCSADVLPSESVVPNIDFSAFWTAMAMVLQGGVFGDIRQFFPRARAMREPSSGERLTSPGHKHRIDS